MQVASHAQKYFIRLNSMNKKDKRRSSIHDITSVNPSSADMTGQLRASSFCSLIVPMWLPILRVCGAAPSIIWNCHFPSPDYDQHVVQDIDESTVHVVPVKGTQCLVLHCQLHCILKSLLSWCMHRVCVKSNQHVSCHQHSPAM